MTTQKNANEGIPTIALTAITQNANSNDYVAVVTPNDGSIPTRVNDVRLSQAGASTYYDAPLSSCWSERQGHFEYIMFYSYYG